MGDGEVEFQRQRGEVRCGGAEEAAEDVEAARIEGVEPVLQILARPERPPRLGQEAPPRP